MPVAQVLDAGSAQPTGGSLDFFYGWITYEIDLVASRLIVRDLGRLRRAWVSGGSLRGRRARRRTWSTAEAELRTQPFCVRDEAVITGNGQTSTVVRTMQSLLDASLA